MESMNEADCVQRLIALIAKHGSQRAAAAEVGITQAYFSDVIQGKRAVGPKVLKYFGLKREVRLVKGLK